MCVYVCICIYHVLMTIIISNDCNFMTTKTTVNLSPGKNVKESCYYVQNPKYAKIRLTICSVATIEKADKFDQGFPIFLSVMREIYLSGGISVLSPSSVIDRSRVYWGMLPCHCEFSTLAGPNNPIENYFFELQLFHHLPKLQNNLAAVEVGRSWANTQLH